MAGETQIALSTLQIVGLVLPVTLVGGRFYIDLLENRKSITGEATDPEKIQNVINQLLFLLSLLIVSAVLAIAYLLISSNVGVILTLSLAILGFAFAEFVIILFNMRDEFDRGVM